MESKSVINAVVFAAVFAASAFPEGEIIVETSTVMALQTFETTENDRKYYTEKNGRDFEDQNEDELRQSDGKKKESDDRTDQGYQHEEGETVDEQDTQHDTQNWNYHGIYGPGNWSLLHKICDIDNRSRQSPINIETQKTTLNEMLTDISVIVDRIHDDRVTIVNTGHSVNFAYNRTTIRLVGGGFGHTYRVAGAHFHWGSDSSTGSEHQIDGTSFPLEMHVVGYDEDNYDDVQAAASADGDAIAVLSVLFRISEQNNDQLSPIVSRLKHVREPGASVGVDYFDLTHLLPSNQKHFFRYEGSLTTPPCREGVVWTVFSSVQTISTEQLSEFRSLQYEGGTEATNSAAALLFNWRPVQPIGQRTVQRSFSPPIVDLFAEISAPDSENSKWIEDDVYRASNSAAEKNFSTENFYPVVLLLISVFTSIFSAQA